MLGGIDMDDRIATLVLERCNDSSLLTNKAVLRRVAEIAKISLSQQEALDHIDLDNNTYHFNMDQYDL